MRQQDDHMQFILGVLLIVLVMAIMVAFFASTETIKPDPYRGCRVVATEQTGESKRVGAKFTHTEYETIKTWDCNAERKLQVIWER